MSYTRQQSHLKLLALIIIFCWTQILPHAPNCNTSHVLTHLILIRALWSRIYLLYLTGKNRDLNLGSEILASVCFITITGFLKLLHCSHLRKYFLASLKIFFATFSCFQPTVSNKPFANNFANWSLRTTMNSKPKYEMCEDCFQLDNLRTNLYWSLASLPLHETYC